MGGAWRLELERARIGERDAIAVTVHRPRFAGEVGRATGDQVGPANVDRRRARREAVIAARRSHQSAGCPPGYPAREQCWRSLRCLPG